MLWQLHLVPAEAIAMQCTAQWCLDSLWARCMCGASLRAQGAQLSPCAPGPAQLTAGMCREQRHYHHVNKIDPDATLCCLPTVPAAVAQLLEAAGANARVCRVMPNTPCLVGETAAAMCLGGKVRVICRLTPGPALPATRATQTGLAGHCCATRNGSRLAQMVNVQ